MSQLFCCSAVRTGGTVMAEVAFTVCYTYVTQSLITLVTGLLYIHDIVTWVLLAWWHTYTYICVMYLWPFLLMENFFSASPTFLASWWISPLCLFVVFLWLGLTMASHPFSVAFPVSFLLNKVLCLLFCGLLGDHPGLGDGWDTLKFGWGKRVTGGWTHGPLCQWHGCCHTI